MNRHRARMACIGLSFAATRRPSFADSHDVPAERDGLSARASAATSLQAVDDGTRVVTPAVATDVSDASRGWALEARYLADIVSGASVDVVSAASQAESGRVHWDEVRHVGVLGAELKPSSFGARVDAAYSGEPDHLHFAGGATLEWDVGSGPVTMIAGYSRSRDVIGRANVPFRVLSQSVDEDQITAGVALRAGPATDWLFVGNVGNQRGDASDPYRHLPLFAPDVATAIPKGASPDLVNQRRLPGIVTEHLPATRGRYALAGRFTHDFGAGTFTAFERVYVDSWAVAATTTEIAFAWGPSRRWTVTPHLRLHLQKGADFWRRAYIVTPPAVLPRYRSGDRRLSPLETAGGGLVVAFAVGTNARPHAWTLLLNTDIQNSQFSDALYLTSRTALLSGLAVLATFE